MEELLGQLSTRLRQALMGHEKELSLSREIRVRTHSPVLLCGRENIPVQEFVPNARDMEELLLCLTGQALYAHEAQLSQGYLTLRGGHRAGVCGHMVRMGDKPLHLTSVQSVNIRSARQVPCEARALEALRYGERLRSVLVVSPPGYGKTTLLRDLSKRMSDEGVQVAIADERSELAACVGGVPQLDVGQNTDVIDGIPKAESIAYLLRAMSPQLIVSDEIGSEEDADAIMDALRCGVNVLCSAHGATLTDVRGRSALRRLMQENVFDRIMVLGQRVGHVIAVYDRSGRPC